ncbi:CHASE3 domain-containing protein [Pseudoalteromonas obscura]|uniref:CHASE3 domain-containing protein n=1 Tax=Pseudoalteromonas obscura TaxID=3048491 RepID=A0ABT7EEB4_9GAMM|nr:CHASE3 domain-containing protein [Pseudoalteromonas sp. P94(2023)]MDK2593626.1 CHASE3 domain-containing protein [Pseudoalteromonas sp. P94(2023)]
MRYSLKTVLTVFILASLITALVNLIILNSSQSVKDKHEYWVIHTHEVIDLVNQLRTQIKNAETGQRGFILTRNVLYLQPYNTGTKLTSKLFEALKTKTRDNPIQQNRLSELIVVLNDKFSELEQTIQLVKSGQEQEALELVRTDLGRHLMGEIENTLLAFEKEERVLLEARTSEYKEAKTLYHISIWLLEAMYLILIIWVIYTIKYKVMEPLHCLNKYINSDFSDNPILIAQGDSCREVEQLASDIIKRCTDSEATIVKLQHAHTLDVNLIKAQNQFLVDLSLKTKLPAHKVYTSLKKFKSDSASLNNSDELSELISIAHKLVEAPEEIDNFVNNAKQSDTNSNVAD